MAFQYYTDKCRSPVEHRSATACMGQECCGACCVNRQYEMIACLR